MKCFSLLVFVCALVSSLSWADEMKTIEGQVFIRTKGGETVKLSLVDVLVVDEKAVTDHIAGQRAKAEPLLDYLRPQDAAIREKTNVAIKEVKLAGQELDKDISNAKLQAAYDQKYKEFKDLRDATKGEGDLLSKIIYLRTARFLLDGLTEIVASTKTDADGKFSVKLKNGNYVVIAESGRAIGKENELYTWLVKLRVDADSKLFLANDNMCDGDSPDSLKGISPRTAGTAELSFASIQTFIKTQKEAEAQLKAETERKAKLELSAKMNAERQNELEKYRKNPKAAQQKAIELFPALKIPESALNQDFVARVKRYQLENKAYFLEPDWPIRLAEECDNDLRAKAVPK